jgi:hypothetical protein
MEFMTSGMANGGFAIGLPNGLLMARTDGRTYERPNHPLKTSCSSVTRTNFQGIARLDSEAVTTA